MKKINNDICIVGKGVYFNNTLVLSDIHIGYEEALNKQGVLIPRFQFKDITSELDWVFSELGKKRIDKIIINGDLKHEFGGISETEWRNTLRLLDYFSKKCKNIILLKGNHDKILGPIAKKRNVVIKEYEVINDKLVIHGDKITEKMNQVLKKRKIKTIIIGHEHPAVGLRDGRRVEKYKCFLKGKWKRYNLIVMPSFTPVVEGTDVLKEKLLSPFLQQVIGNFGVYVIGDKVYDFGKIKNLK
ncbi:MAG: metallophosphoesterase [Nanoarchaeota archaeon]|nr:metallophosphoesterase [Nanoarchaeota archaeon]